MWYNGLASEGEGSSPPQVATEKVLDNAPTVWYTGDSREGNRTTPQKVLDDHSKVWYNLGKSSVRHGNNSLKSLPCTARKPQKKVLDNREKVWYNVDKHERAKNLNLEK